MLQCFSSMLSVIFTAISANSSSVSFYRVEFVKIIVYNSLHKRNRGDFVYVE